MLLNGERVKKAIVVDELRKTADLCTEKGAEMLVTYHSSNDKDYYQVAMSNSHDYVDFLFRFNGSAKQVDTIRDELSDYDCINWRI